MVPELMYASNLRLYELSESSNILHLVFSSSDTSVYWSSLGIPVCFVSLSEKVISSVDVSYSMLTGMLSVSSKVVSISAPG